MAATATEKPAAKALVLAGGERRAAMPTAKPAARAPVTGMPWQDAGGDFDPSAFWQASMDD